MIGSETEKVNQIMKTEDWRNVSAFMTWLRDQDYLVVPAQQFENSQVTVNMTNGLMSSYFGVDFIALMRERGKLLVEGVSHDA